MHSGIWPAALQRVFDKNAEVLLGIGFMVSISWTKGIF